MHIVLKISEMEYRDMKRQEAISIFHQMWGDMRNQLGNTPPSFKRLEFKRDWCAKHGYKLLFNCPLCEYTSHDCNICPILWASSDTYCTGINNNYYLVAPIDEILSLPERKINGSNAEKR